MDYLGDFYERKRLLSHIQTEIVVVNENKICFNRRIISNENFYFLVDDLLTFESIVADFNVRRPEFEQFVDGLHY
jgi:hypothetical protein